MIVIEFNNVSYAYTNQQDPVLNNINLTINKGEWVALVGHNGSGKSTLAKLINGLIKPNEGQVYVNRQEVTDENIWDIRQQVGMVFQNPENQFVGTTVIDDVVFGLENIGLSKQVMEERVDLALKLVGLADYKWKEPFNLSGGQKQRLAIAGVLAMLPDTLVLDEATTMLDPVSRTELINTIKEIHEKESLTTISITHDMNEILLADRVIVLKNGLISFDGIPKELIKDTPTLKNSGLMAPFIVKLTNAFKRNGVAFDQEPTTISDLVKQL